MEEMDWFFSSTDYADRACDVRIELEDELREMVQDAWEHPTPEDEPDFEVSVGKWSKHPSAPPSFTAPFAQPEPQSLREPTGRHQKSWARVSAVGDCGAAFLLQLSGKTAPACPSQATCHRSRSLS